MRCIYSSYTYSYMDRKDTQMDDNDIAAISAVYQSAWTWLSGHLLISACLGGFNFQNGMLLSKTYNSTKMILTALATVYGIIGISTDQSPTDW